jgi:hypothetical protein
LPIGNLTSQFFANLYLNQLDYFVKFELGERYYIRYMDDFLVFGNDKNTLSDVRITIKNFLMDNLGLSLHEGKTQIYKTDKGIKFLGFRLYREYRRLASGNVRRFRKRLIKFEYLFENGKMGVKQILDSIRCWTAHAKYADTTQLRLTIYSGLRKKNESFAGFLEPALLDGATIDSGQRTEGVVAQGAGFRVQKR